MKEFELTCDFAIGLDNFFTFCFLSTEFEEQFLTFQLENVPLDEVLSRRPSSQHVTVTQWIYDANQPIPISEAGKNKAKGVHTRMKFYKIRDPTQETTKTSDMNSLTQVTETQVSIYLTKKKKKLKRREDEQMKSFSGSSIGNNGGKNSKCKTIKDELKSDTVICVHSLVLPQSSLTLEPVFRIEATWTLFVEDKKGMKRDGGNGPPSKGGAAFIGSHNKPGSQTTVKLNIKVECMKKSWGMESIVEKILMDQARHMYQGWLNFATHWILSRTKTGGTEYHLHDSFVLKEDESFVVVEKTTNVNVSSGLNKRTTTTVLHSQNTVVTSANTTVLLGTNMDGNQEQTAAGQTEDVNSNRNNTLPDIRVDTALINSSDITTSTVDTLSSLLISTTLGNDSRSTRGLNKPRVSLFMKCQRFKMEHGHAHLIHRIFKKKKKKTDTIKCGVIWLFSLFLESSKSYKFVITSSKEANEFLKMELTCIRFKLCYYFLSETK
ncbi:hypothetical protein RFI_29300 [Reticulomyxa filosa]|uniref:VASt domain-containing protein n=1 Tax=Reticulomyxa filosa TaxID=46433 RepID=X6M357_RETFI|nr:hypothetical protein RFI_29300 [Reticulomyxa filosa]|eukprot:ETO08086.1 hypothetical protein RFI_29300 [Reticulomyxa filosa]